MKKLLACSLVLLCLGTFSVSAISSELVPNNLVDKTEQLSKDKKFIQTMQMLADLGSGILQLPVETKAKISGKSASKALIRETIENMKFKNVAAFLAFESTLRGNLKELKTDYADVFADRKLIDQAISTNIKSKNIRVSLTNAKIDDDNCLVNWLGLMSLCNAMLAAGSEMDPEELLLYYFACVDGAAVFMYACSGNN